MMIGAHVLRQRGRYAARTDGSSAAVTTMRKTLYAYLELDAYLASQGIA